MGRGGEDSSVEAGSPVSSLGAVEPCSVSALLLSLCSAVLSTACNSVSSLGAVEPCSWLSVGRSYPLYYSFM